MVTKSWIEKFKLNQYTRKPNWDGESELEAMLIILYKIQRRTSLNKICTDIVVEIYIDLEHPGPAAEIESL